MSLPWIRLDVGLSRNHKILVLTTRKQFQAVTAYVFGLLYVGEQGTDGFIPREALPGLSCTTKVAAELVEAGLWKADPGGWMVNGWADKQLTSDEAQQRSNRARAAAMARWSK